MPRIQLIADLPGHPDPAWSVAFNPTRSLLASCSTDKTVRLYSYSLPPSSTDADEDPVYPTFQFITSIDTQHKRTVRSLAWSPSGLTLATGSFDSSISIWEELDEREEGVDGGGEDDGMVGVAGTGGGKEWECVTSLEGHESECKSVGYSADGGLLASCSRDKSVWIWEVQPDSDFECISVLMEHTQDVKCLTWHPTEEILATASYDASILLFADDPEGDWSPFQKVLPKLPCTTLPFPSSPSSPTTTELSIPPLLEPPTIWSLAFSPSGKHLVSGSDAGSIRIYARTGKTTESPWVEMGCWGGHGGRAVFGLSWQGVQEGDVGEREGEGEWLGRILSGGGDGKIIIWGVTKLPSGKISVRILTHLPSPHSTADVNSVQWCRRTLPDGEEGSERNKELVRRTRGMFVSCGDEGGVKVWMYEP